MANGKKPRRRMGANELAVRSPVWLAMKSAPMTLPAAATLVIDARLALHRITLGECGPSDPDELAMASSVALILSEFHKARPEEDRIFTDNYEPDVIRSQEALMNAQRRANAGASFGFTGPELSDVKLMLDLFEQQLQHWPHKDVMRALMEAVDRIRKGQVMVVEWAADAPTKRGS